MSTFYSIVNPKKWNPNGEDNLISDHSAVDTFQSVMYAHYNNICKLIETIGFFNVLLGNYKIYCLSYPEKYQYLKAVGINDVECNSGTIYHFNHMYHHGIEYLSDVKHYPPTWNLIYGDLLSMKKFTQAYKTQEGDKLNIWVNDIATDTWVNNPMLNPPKGVLYVHTWSRTGMHIQLVNEEI